MIQLTTILTQREFFLLMLCTVTYIALFVVAVQNSRRKILLLKERLDKVHAMQGQQDIAANTRKIEELERLIKKLGDENSLLRLELEEKKAKLDFDNKVAMLENERREQAETIIFGSDIYLHIKKLINEGSRLGASDWQQLEQVVNAGYANFTERLYSLYRLSEQDYHVSLLIKVRIQPKDIALLTNHSKESIASTRSRLYAKVFGRKGSSRAWDDFILSL